MGSNVAHPGIFVNQLEKDLEKSVINLFEVLGVFIYKPSKARDRRHKTRHSDNGAPDLLIFHKGRTVALELKTESGAQSVDQKAFQGRLETQKIAYYIVRSIDQAMAIWNQIKSLD